MPRPIKPEGSENTISLKELDRDILHQMSLDPLASNRIIAEAINVPTSQVSARIRWLDQKNVTRVIAILDLKKTGQDFCFIRISVRGRRLDDVAEEISLIRQTLNVNALSGGKSDLLVLLRYSNSEELNNLTYSIIAKIKGVHCLSISNVVDIPVFRPSYVTYMPHFLPIDVEENVLELGIDYINNPLDEIDRYIIAELQKDARKSINNIARRYNINSSTIRYRVKALEAKGLLRFITVFDPSAIGIHAFALMEVTISANHIEKFIKTISKNDQINQIFVCVGDTTLVSIIQADSIETVQQLKTERIATIEGIIDVRISPITHTYKMDLRWGQRFTE